MSKIRHSAEDGVLVRFWAIDHHRAEAIPWPISPWPKLIYAEEGTLQVDAGRHRWIVPSNRALWVEAGLPHPATCLGRAKVRTLYFAPHLPIRRDNGPIEVSPLLRELIRESCRIGPLMRGEARPEAITSLLRHEIEQAPLVPAAIVLPRSDLLRTWANKFLTDPSSEAQIPVSRRTLERQMLKETSLTLGQWRQQARVFVGLRALAAGATVVEASVEAGYATASGFIQSFRKKFGITPGQLR